MLSEVDSDDGPAFPMVGEGDDVSHFSSDGVVPDLEAELAADEECSRAVAFAGDSYDDRDGSDQSMFLPIAEPTAGDSINAVDATPSPGDFTNHEQFYHRCDTGFQEHYTATNQQQAWRVGNNTDAAEVQTSQPAGVLG